MSSSREASLSRSQKRKMDKMEQNRKLFDEQKLIDGAYCIITPLNLPPSLALASPAALFNENSTGRGRQGSADQLLSINRNSAPSPMGSLDSGHFTTGSGMMRNSGLRYSDSALAALSPVQYIINHEGAVFGSGLTKTKLNRTIDIADHSLSSSHFRIYFKSRNFYLYDNESKTGTFIRRNVYNHPTDCSYLLQKGRVLLTGRHLLEVIECIDSKSKSAAVDDYKVVVKVSTLGDVDVRQITVTAKDVSQHLEPSLCSPADADLSDPDISEDVKSDDEHEDEVDDMAADNADDAPESRTFESDASTVVKSYASSTDGDTEVIEMVHKEIEHHVRFLNGRFYLKNDPNVGLKFFSRVKKWASRAKASHHLSSGDIIRAGRLEFRVDIRCAPRPISDKKKEDIVSAKDIAAFEFGNWLQREQMEDRHVVIDGFGTHPTDAFFGVYDGHAGRVIADFMSCIFHVNLLHAMNSSGRRASEDMKESMKEAFEISGKMVSGLGEEAYYAGTTAVCALLWKDEKTDGERKLTVGNVGDCRSIVFQADGYCELTQSHLATSEAEAARLQSLGTTIVDGRVRGLTVTRAFGDLALSDKGITYTPHITEYTIRANDKYLVFASDGVWDVVQPKEVVELISPYSSATEMCKALVHAAYTRHSDDNITAIVVCL